MQVQLRMRGDGVPRYASYDFNLVHRWQLPAA